MGADLLAKERRDFRAKLRFACTLATKALCSLALRGAVGKGQVAATRKISLILALRAVDFSPSLTATRFDQAQFESLSANAKRVPIGTLALAEKERF